jgi:hypothetical protein
MLLQAGEQQGFDGTGELVPWFYFSKQERKNRCLDRALSSFRLAGILFMEKEACLPTGLAGKHV